MLEGEDVEEGDGERDVVFGRMPLSGVKGLFGEHWAVKVGRTWFEVGPGPDGVAGHINAHLVSDGPSKSNIVGQYDIVKSEGDNADSGAVPSSVAYSPTSFFWLLVLAVMGEVTFYILYFFVVLNPELNQMNSILRQLITVKVIWPLVSLVVSVLAPLLFVCLVAKLGQTIGRCLGFWEEGARWSGGLAVLLVALSAQAFRVVQSYDVDALGGPGWGVALFVLFSSLQGLYLAPLGQALGRCLGLGEARRWGVYGELVTAYVGGGLGPICLLLAKYFPNYGSFCLAVFWGLIPVSLLTGVYYKIIQSLFPPVLVWSGVVWSGFDFLERDRSCATHGSPSQWP